jgi:hypothetical protein
VDPRGLPPHGVVAFGRAVEKASAKLALVEKAAAVARAGAGSAVANPRDPRKRSSPSPTAEIKPPASKPSDPRKRRNPSPSAESDAQSSGVRAPGLYEAGSKSKKPMFVPAGFVPAGKMTPAAAAAVASVRRARLNVAVPSVRALLRCLSGLSVCHGKSNLYGAFV